MFASEMLDTKTIHDKTFTVLLAGFEIIVLAMILVSGFTRAYAE